MKKKYSINWEDDAVVSVEVDGVQYDHPDQIPDPDDRAQVRRLMARSSAADFDAAFDAEFEAEFRQLERDTAQMPKVIVGIFLAVAVIMLGVAAFSAMSTGARLSREASAAGRVVDLVARQDEGGQAIYFPVVEFSLPNERRQTVQLAEGSSPPGYAVGEAVTVLYDPERPTSARIKSIESTVLMWLLPGIAGTVGVAFLIAAVFAGKFLRSDADDKKPIGN